MRRFPKEDEAYRSWIRDQDCLLDTFTWHEYVGEVQPHHVHAKRRFGDWLREGGGNLVPLCHGCHRHIHQHGGQRALEELGVVGMNLEAEAFRYGCRYLWHQLRELSTTTADALASALAGEQGWGDRAREALAAAERHEHDPYKGSPRA